MGLVSSIYFECRGATGINLFPLIKTSRWGVSELVYFTTPHSRPCPVSSELCGTIPRPFPWERTTGLFFCQASCRENLVSSAIYFPIVLGSSYTKSRHVSPAPALIHACRGTMHLSPSFPTAIIIYIRILLPRSHLSCPCNVHGQHLPACLPLWMDGWCTADNNHYLCLWRWTPVKPSPSLLSEETDLVPSSINSCSSSKQIIS